MLVMVLLISGCKKEFHLLYWHYQYPNEQYFGTDIYSEILYICTKDERKAVSNIMDAAEKAFSYVGPKVDANDASDEIGMLARYYPYCDIAAEEHLLELITVKLKAQTGVMWVAYCCQAFDSNGDLVYASGNKNQKILARWELEQIAGA